MNSTELYQEAMQFKHSIHQIIYHPYINQYIEKPVIDLDKLLLLCFLTEEKNERVRTETIINTMIVQIALDVHERMAFIDLTEDNHKKRQLTVLAGDYYSSIYYERLTAINEQTLIRTLADGIREVNELKTKFLYGGKLEVSEIIAIQHEIECTIFNKFAQLTTGNELSPLYSRILLFKRLITEMKQANSIWIHLFGRLFYGREKNLNKIAFLSQKEYDEAVATIKKIIISEQANLERLLTNTYDEIANSIFLKQVKLFNEIGNSDEG